ncbi:tyrosine-type recombinase/integrase [Halalkalibaculum sp. DA3122]|uniref:tyrosine-type recombinase/integrase n=1 Tax=Halalkalibaculum sp. DA3122 TaxID=3373607 RepID=UPI003755070C
MSKLKLTDPFIRNHPAPEKRIEIYDKHTSGLAVRITPNGSKSFVYRYRFNDKVKRFTIGRFPKTSLADAREEAGELEYKVNHGTDPLEEKKAKKSRPKPKTFEEIIEAYKEEHLPTLREYTQNDYKRRIRVITRSLNTKLPIKDVKRRTLISFLNKKAKTAPGQAKYLQTILSGIFQFAMDKGLVDANIAQKITIKTPEREDKGTKYKNVALDDQQIRKLWKGFTDYGDPVGSLFKFLLLTGQRCGETRRMKWQHVDFKKRIWEIPPTNTKNKTKHFVYLSDMAIDILESLGNGSDYVFTSPVQSGHIAHPGKPPQRIRKRVKVPEFNIHSLRTTFATRLAGLAVQPQVLSKILNHKKPGAGSTITAAYNKHEYKEERWQAMNRWSHKLKQILEDKQESKIAGKIG